MTASPDPSADDPQAGYQPSASGSSPLSAGYDAATGYQHSVGYPSDPVQYPAPGTTPQFDPANQAAPYGGAAYDPAGYSPPPYSPPPSGQPPYGPPPYGPPPFTGYGPPYPFGVAPRNGMGTAALVLGIIGVVTSWTVLGAVILGILAIIFGSIGLNRAKRGEATNRGVAVAGLVLGIVALTLLVLLIGSGLYAA